MFRRASLGDARGICSIYTPIVERTAISFETVAPTAAEMDERIAGVLDTHDWWIAETDGGTSGYAYATTHRSREARRYSAEVSAYVHEDHRGKGLGAALCQELFASLEVRGFHAMLAGVALPNEPSIALHKALGFQSIGSFV